MYLYCLINEPVIFVQQCLNLYYWTCLRYAYLIKCQKNLFFFFLIGAGWKAKHLPRKVLLSLYVISYLTLTMCLLYPARMACCSLLMSMLGWLLTNAGSSWVGLGCCCCCWCKLPNSCELGDPTASFNEPKFGVGTLMGMLPLHLAVAIFISFRTSFTTSGPKQFSYTYNLHTLVNTGETTKGVTRWKGVTKIRIRKKKIVKKIAYERVREGKR